MFCKYCGKEIPDGAVCDCEEAVKAQNDVGENPSLNSEQQKAGKDIYIQRVEVIASVFGQNKFKIAGILLVIYSVLSAIIRFSIFRLVDIIPLLFGIFIIAFSTQTKENSFQISGGDTLKRAHLASVIFMVIGIVGVIAAIFGPIILSDKTTDFVLYDVVGEDQMLESYQEYKSNLGEEIVIDENNKEQILSSSDFRVFAKLVAMISYVMIALLFLVYTLFTLSVKKTIKHLKEELTSKEWPPILKLGTTGFLNFIGGFFTVTALLSLGNIVFAVCFACLAASMFMIAQTFKEYNNERVLLTQRVLVQDRSQNLEKSSL